MVCDGREAAVAREDEPGRPQHLRRYLAGQAFVVAGRFFDRDAPAEAEVEQFFGRESAAPVLDGDDDPIDLMLIDEPDYIAGQAEDRRIDEALADKLGLIVHEAD